MESSVRVVIEKLMLPRYLELNHIRPKLTEVRTNLTIVHYLVVLVIIKR